MFNFDLEARLRALREAGMPEPGSEDTRYGWPREIWDTFTPKQQSAAADMFRLALPELALQEGLRQVLADEDVTPTTLGKTEPKE